MMNKQLKFLPIILLGLCLTLSSWTIIDNVSFEDQTRLNDNEKSKLSFNNTSYVIKKDGSYDYYVEDKFQYNLSVTFKSEITFKEDKKNNTFIAIAGTDVIEITNPNNVGEDLGVVISKENGERREIDGFRLNGGVELETTAKGGGGWGALLGGIGAIADAVADIFTPSETADCGAAAAAGCGEGNVASVRTETESGFFGDKTRCEYECKD